MDKNHTPTPWRINYINKNMIERDPTAEQHAILPATTIATTNTLNRETYEADTAFIIKAVNSHHELLEALKLLKQYVSETNHSDFWKEHTAGKKTMAVINKLTE